MEGPAPHEPIDDAAWASAAQRLRRLHRVQLAVLAAFGLAMLLVGLGSAVLNNRHEARHGRLDDAIYQVADAFDGLRQVQASIAARGSTATSDAVLTLRSLARLREVHAAQGREFSTNARMDAAGDAVLAALERAVTAGSTANEPLTMQDLQDQLTAISVAGSQWFGAMRVAREQDNRQGDAIRRRLVVLTTAMVAMLSLGAMLLWRGLGRARARLVLELRRTGLEHDAMRRIALAAAAGADADELTRIAREVAAAPLAADEVILASGDPARAELERAATGDESGAVLVREVRIGGEPWGAFGARWSTAEPPPDAPGRLERLAATLGLALEGVAARAEREAQAVTDSLTGLPNHRPFHEELARRMDEALTEGGDLSVAIVDVDALAEVNAAFGHAAGDEVLAEVAARLTAAAEPGDLLARISGEEFGWLMACPGDRGEAAAERARAAVSGSPVSSAGAVTISVGIATVTDAGSPAEVMGCAGTAVQAAKADGRDRVCRYSQRLLRELEGTARGRAAQAREFAALQALARAVDLRDHNTQRHSERVAAVSHLLALELGWPPPRAARLRQAALVHDVGKVGVPDSVLLKPGRLTSEERAIIETHAPLGATIVSEVLDPEQVSWVRGHHERIDGAGYPDRLAGPQIPDGARLMAVADTWDAMTADRPYRDGMPAARAIAICTEVAETQLCRHCVNALVALHERGDLARIASGG